MDTTFTPPRAPWPFVIGRPSLHAKRSRGGNHPAVQPRVLAVLRTATEPLTAAEIAKQAGLTQAQAYNALTPLHRRGEVASPGLWGQSRLYCMPGKS